MEKEERSYQQYEFRVNHVIDYIQNNLDKNLSLDSLATIASFSKFHFHRVFKSVIGESLNDYVSRVRVEYSASRLLHQSQVPIATIAYASGFSSPAAYCRAFKNYYGMSPSKWRSAHNQEQSIDNAP